MEDLRLVAIAPDGSHLVLGGRQGSHYRLPLDDRLQTALRRDRPHLGQLEIELDSSLRPREIQARIRAGATPADVAAAASLPIHRVERYAGPVLAERAHMAQAAQRAACRRRSDGAPDAPLGELVAGRLAAQGVDEDSVEWDAWRRDDGRWTVHLDFRQGGRARVAEWIFDPAVRVVSAASDEARALVEDRPLPSPGDPRPAEAPAARGAGRGRGWPGPRLVAVRGGDEDGDPTPDPLAEPTADPLDERMADPEGTERGEAGGTAGEDEAVAANGDGAAPGRRALRGRSARRASVPSWDDILFGSRRRD